MLGHFWPFMNLESSGSGIWTRGSIPVTYDALSLVTALNRKRESWWSIYPFFNVILVTQYLVEEANNISLFHSNLWPWNLWFLVFSGFLSALRIKQKSLILFTL